VNEEAMAHWRAVAPKEKIDISHLFLTLALDGGAWLVAFPGSFTISIGLPIPTE